MAATKSTMLALGTAAPDFSLPDTEGNLVSLQSFSEASGLLVAFICNHCPYVIHIRSELKKLGDDLEARGVKMVAISSNDVGKYGADSPAKMKEERAAAGYSFAYLYDESQEVAKAYRAACTPEFYLFDGDQRLVYRGQLDDSRPRNGKPVTGKDLRGAVDALLAGEAISAEQQPGVGCNIKWKPGNEPDYS